MRTSRKGQIVLTAQPADDKRSMVRFCPGSVASGHSAHSVDVFLVHARLCTSPLVFFPVLAFSIFLLNEPLQINSQSRIRLDGRGAATRAALGPGLVRGGGVHLDLVVRGHRGR
jgi:hypothetical protein